MVQKGAPMKIGMNNLLLWSSWRVQLQEEAAISAE